MPGDLVGFGGTITATPDAYDASTPFLVINDAEFVLNAGTDPVGIFIPIITNNYMVIGPDAGNGEVNPYTQHFDASQGTGIGSYQINSFQSVGDQANGTLVISYSEFSVSPNDPSFDPINDPLAGGAVLTLTAQVNVIVGAAPVTNASVAPEGSPLALCALGVGLVCFGRYRATALARLHAWAGKEPNDASASRSQAALFDQATGIQLEDGGGRL
jgi:hypothetical protein